MLILLACCGGIAFGADVIQTNTPHVWPSPPDAPRIVFVRSITQPADAGVKQSGLKRFANWISGASVGNEKFSKPFGLAVDEQDNLCLTDTGANVAGWLDRPARSWRRWDRAGDLRFSAPVSVAKKADVVFVADSALGMVVAFDPSGKVRFRINHDLERPTGLAISGNRLFVADAQQHCLVSFDLNGRFLAKFGRRGAEAGEFNFPTHVAADAAGHLFVTDSMNSRVQVLDAAGIFQNQIGSAGDTSGHLSRPKGVAVDTFGHIYVVDAGFDNVQIFDRAGRLLLSFGQSGQGEGEFWLPNGIAIGRDNQIYVADSYNRRVQVFKYVGQE